MQTPARIRIGTRKSVLALAQAEIVRQKLGSAFPALELELVPLVTTGDRNPDKVLAEIGGKGLFTKELGEALLGRHIDIAVHSLKDMEARLADGLAIAAVLERGDPRDCLIAPQAKTIASLPANACVGTSSPRRTVQIQMLRPDLQIVPFRGNVTTRLIKIKKGEADATLLALAGLKRIHMEHEATEILDVERFMPAAGQGIIAVECEAGNEKLRAMLTQINHPETWTASLAERRLLGALGGSCRTPIAGYARFEGERLRLDAMIANPGGSTHLTVSRTGNASDAETMGEDAAKELLARGGNKWVA